MDSFDGIRPCPAHYTECVPPEGADWPPFSVFHLIVVETRVYPDEQHLPPHQIPFPVKVVDYINRLGSYSPQMLSIFIPLLTTGKIRLDFPGKGDGAYERLELLPGTPLMTKPQAVTVVTQCLRCFAESPQNDVVCRRNTPSMSATQSIPIQLKKPPIKPNP